MPPSLATDVVDFSSRIRRHCVASRRRQYEEAAGAGDGSAGNDWNAMRIKIHVRGFQLIVCRVFMIASSTDMLPLSSSTLAPPPSPLQA